MPECAKCRNKNKVDGIIGCEGPCQRWFHYSCIGMSESEFKLLQKNENLLYACASCRRKCEFGEKIQIDNLNDSLGSIEKQIALLKNNLNKEEILQFVKNEMDSLYTNVDTILKSFKENLQAMFQDEMKKLYDTPTQETDTCDMKLHSNKTLFSQVVQQSSNVLVVKPKNSAQNYSKTRSEILHNINPVESSIQLSKIKNVRDGGVLIGCSSEEETHKLKCLVNDKLSCNYDINELDTLKPRIKIVGLTDKHDEDVLIMYLKKQNKQIFHDNSTIKVLDISSLKRNKSLYQVKISLDVNSYNRAMHESSLFVGYDCCTIYDAVELRVCYKCCGFSHLAKNCNRDTKCPKCSNDHGVNECRISDKKSFKCINCLSQGLLNVDHAAWDSRCPVYAGKLNKFKADMFNIK